MIAWTFSIVKKKICCHSNMPGGIQFLAPITQLVYNCMWSLALGKRLLVFIDDLNMPQVDTYGTQQPIALLKLLLEKGGMYDRGKDLNWKMFKDIFFTAAMGKVCMCVSTWILQIKWFMSTRLDSSRIAKSIQTMMYRNYAYMYVCIYDWYTIVCFHRLILCWFCRLEEVAMK